MLSTFLDVLLNSLVNQSHDLLKEDIIITIHTMASVDLRAFNGEFMQHFLLRAQGLTDHQKSDMLEAFQNQEVNFSNISFIYDISLVRHTNYQC